MILEATPDLKYHFLLFFVTRGSVGLAIAVLIRKHLYWSFLQKQVLPGLWGNTSASSIPSCFCWARYTWTDSKVRVSDFNSNSLRKKHLDELVTTIQCVSHTGGSPLGHHRDCSAVILLFINHVANRKGTEHDKINTEVAVILRLLEGISVNGRCIEHHSSAECVLGAQKDSFLIHWLL